jgi:hydroxymethylglutaryl-CoA reductase
MKDRGGGVVDLTVRKLKKSKLDNCSGVSHWLVVHFHVDVCDAMGANSASTIAEGMAPWFVLNCKAQIGLRIVSNLSTERMSKV